EENHYYPFGLKHKNYGVDMRTYRENNLGQIRLPLVSEVSYKYKYNGKELQDELGLNWYDYGARNYYPAIGRWMNIDPLAEDREWLSPYNYVQNNPVVRIDPDGLLDDLAVGDTDPPTKKIDNSSRLSGWNQAAQKMTNDFYSSVQEFSKDPINNALGGLSSTLNSAATLVSDVTGLSNLMGIENKTANGIANAIETVAEVPNMTKEQQGGLMVVITVGIVETAITKKAGVSQIPDIKSQANDIKNNLNNGKNSVTIKTPNGQTRYDLDGKAHGNVPTPHKQSYQNNVVNGQVKSVSRTTKQAEAMSQQDVRVVRKTLEKRNSN
ncbi:MAG: RHS repeat-associated core domain-containing protein, partial [Candidatus Paceibacterota bacterium]